MKLYLNSEYYLKQDSGRVLLLTLDNLRAKEEFVECIIHPIHAMILSFFNGVELEEGVYNAAKYLNIDELKIRSFICGLIENDKPVGVKLKNRATSVFPTRTLVFRKGNSFNYNPDDFKYDELDIRIKRHLTPTMITFMATTKCATDCIYCYADRSRKNAIVDSDTIIKTIQEARELNVVQFDVIGGEFFLYRDWKKTLKELYKNNYNPYVSTKIPLDEKTILDMREVGMKDIQISLDTLLSSNMQKILRVGSPYHDKMLITLDLLNKYNVDIKLHTILTEYNSSVEDMKSIFNCIKDKCNVSLWKIDVASSTLYKAKDIFSSIKIKRDKLEDIAIYFDSLKKCDMQFKIVSGDLKDIKRLSVNELLTEEKNRFYTKNRQVFCSGNDSSLFILPDGQVTICEELYWKPQFIIGDITKQSLNEIWNSAKALGLYYLKQSRIQPGSPCKTCNIFDKCRTELGGVCWKEIIKAYGDSNWDYPDPHCPQAPKVKRDIYV